MKVEDILRKKTARVATVRMNETVAIAAQLMRTASRDAQTGAVHLELKLRDCPDVFAGLSNLSETLRLGKGPTKPNPKFDRIYWRPQERNLDAIDSLATCIDQHGQPRAILPQLTISETHPGGGNALLNVWNAPPGETRRVPPAIVFVAPTRLCNGYKRQVIDIKGLDLSKGDSSQWPQFALGLGDSKLWDCKHTTPPSKTLLDAATDDQDRTVWRRTPGG